MPAAAAAPAASWIVPSVIGGVGLLDNMFGSGADSRDMQQQGLGLQEDAARAQLPGIQAQSEDQQRQAELYAYLEDLLKKRMANPQQPGSYVDLESGMSQYTGGSPLIPQSFYSDTGPGAMSGIARRELMGLGGLGGPGSGQIAGFANNANLLGESRRDEFSGNIEAIVGALLQSGMLQSQQGVAVGQGINPAVTSPGPSFTGSSFV